MKKNVRKGPRLSIGIIFRNDTRCLERCLEALRPLRDAVPCELVMADTGSDDGSREIAEKYADILFDFPWINDFAAARNAVMDRCSGEWFFSVDTDEYLDQDISPLLEFLGDAKSRKCDVGTLTIRNYTTYDMDGGYSDFLGVRFLRLSTGLRFESPIHEHWPLHPGLGIALLSKLVLHHDGYVNMSREKMNRNIALLRKKLVDDPDNLMLLLQYIESGVMEADFLEQLRLAAARVREKGTGWENIGPPIMRYAVKHAREKKLPELAEWLAFAEETFPDSFFIRIDVVYIAAVIAYEKNDYAECVRRGESCLQAYDDYRNGRGKQFGLFFSTLQMASAFSEQALKLLLAGAHLEEGHLERGAELMSGLDYALLDNNQAANLAKGLWELQVKSELDTAPLMLEVWEGVTSPVPSEIKSKGRTDVFTQIAGMAFSFHLQEQEKKRSDFHRHAYTAFLPLKNDLGAAARVLNADTPAAMEAALLETEDWRKLPIQALYHAIERGIRFPLPGRGLNIEETDVLASRLAQDKERFFPLVRRLSEESGGENWQELIWLRGLSLALARACDWADTDEERGFSVSRIFVKTEREFLPRCYSSLSLTGENIRALPPVHRFGWYCSQAFDALDAGDAAGYVRHLREGLTSCESMKPMVEFLLEHTPELQIPEPKPSGELLELAGKVRGMLAAYAPDDPAVVMIKSSPVYQKVAALIEGPGLALVGGLKQ